MVRSMGIDVSRYNPRIEKFSVRCRTISIRKSNCRRFLEAFNRQAQSNAFGLTKNPEKTITAMRGYRRFYQLPGNRYFGTDESFLIIHAVCLPRRAYLSQMLFGWKRNGRKLVRYRCVDDNL